MTMGPWDIDLICSLRSCSHRTGALVMRFVAHIYQINFIAKYQVLELKVYYCEYVLFKEKMNLKTFFLLYLFPLKHKENEEQNSGVRFQTLPNQVPM